MNAWEPADSEARSRAIETLDANVVVLAGAGTGKTTLLVERVLHLVIQSGLPLDALAAITFTEKAAAEMRGRIALALDELAALAAGRQAGESDSAATRAWRRACRQGSPPPDLHAVALAALAALGRTQVSTIHAFCADLLRAFPIEAGLDPAFRVDPGPEAAARFGPLWDDFLTRELGAAPRRLDLWKRLLVRGWLPQVRDAADRLGHAASVPVGSAAADPRPLLVPLLERGIALARSLRERQQGLSPMPLAFLTQAEEALSFWIKEGPERFKLEVAGRGRIPDRAGQPPQPKATARLAGVTEDEMNAGLKQLWTLLRSLAQHDESACDDLLAAAAPLAQEQAEGLRRAGIVGYDGLLVRARDLLRDHPGVRAALRRRWRHLLVDEFQDTDPLQYEIVLFLGEAAGEPARDPYATRLEPGRLFIVGDPKQSIYRFRGADLAAFDRVARHLAAQGAITLDLTQNFRSGAPLIEAVNRLFIEPGSWMPGDAQPPYVPITGRPTVGAGPEAGDSPTPVEIWTLPEAGRADERRRLEGEAIAAALPDLLAATGATPGEVTLLLRAFTDVSHYLRPLREAGIPFIADGGREFMRRSEVGQLLALARAAARPTGVVPLLAYLRSPVGGVSDRELADWADTGGRWDGRLRPDADRFPRLAAAFARLRALGAGIRSLAPDRALRRLATDSGLLELSAASFEGAQRVANLERLLEAAARLGQQGRLPLIPLLDALEERPGEELESDAPLADEDAHAVRVLTVHRAKGLENRIVILADLARIETVHQPPPILRVARFAGLPPAFAIAVDSTVNAAAIRLAAEERRQEEAEATRLLYVALTRARERLILVASPPGSGRAPWIEALGAWRYDPNKLAADGALLAGGLVRHRLVAPTPLPGGAAPSAPETGTAVAAWESAHAAARAATRRPLLLTPSAAAPTEEGPQDSGDRPGDRSDTGGAHGERDRARAVGIAVHRVLEQWDGSAEASDAHLRGAAVRAAAETGVPSAAIEAEARSVLQAFADSPLGTRLAEVTILGREVPLLLDAAEGVVWSGSLDLLYRDSTGRQFVADFKTDSGTSDIAARYAGQLAVYAEAVRRVFGSSEPPVAELWLLREGRRVTVEGSSAPGGNATPSA